MVWFLHLHLVCFGLVFAFAFSLFWYGFCICIRFGLVWFGFFYGFCIWHLRLLSLQMATCSHCGDFFANRFQLGPHVRTCRHRVLVPDPPESRDPAESPESADLAESPEAPDPPESDPPVIREAVVAPINNAPVNILQLARRPRGSHWGNCEEYPHVTSGLEHAPGPYTKDYREVHYDTSCFACDTSCFACDTSYTTTHRTL